MMPKPKQTKHNHINDNKIRKTSSEKILYESQPNLLLYSDNFIFKIIVLFFLVFMFNPILALVYRMQGTLQSNFQLQFTNMTFIAEVLLFLAILIIIVKLVLDVLDWKNTFYTLTDKRIIIERGLFNTEKISMTYSKVQDIDVSQSILERILGAGDIIIYGGHDNSETILDEVPNPRDVEEIILNQANNSNYVPISDRQPNRSVDSRGYGDEEYDLDNSYGDEEYYDNKPKHNYSSKNPQYNQSSKNYNDNKNYNKKSNTHYFNTNKSNDYADDESFDYRENQTFDNKKFNYEDNENDLFKIKESNYQDKSTKSTKLDKDELISLNERKFKKS